MSEIKLFIYILGTWLDDVASECGEKLIKVNEFKYLRHFITADGKYDKYMTKVCRKIYD